jgi:signal transduction histidine kinase
MRTTGRFALILLSMFILAPGLTLGQNAVLTGLEKPEHIVLKTAGTDTAGIEALIRLSKSIQVKYPDSAILLGKQAIAKSISIRYYDGAASALLSVAAMYSGNKKDQLAGTEYRKLAYLFCQRAIYRKGALMTVYYMDMASPFHIKGEADSVAWYCHKAVETFYHYKVTDSAILANALSNLSTAYITMEEYDMALKYLLEAERLLIRHNKETELVKVYANMGMLYYSKQDYPKSLFYCNKGIELSRKYAGTRYERPLSFIHRTVSQTLLKIGRNEEALQHLYDAIEADKRNPTPIGRAENQLSLALIHCKRKDPRQEEAHLRQALQAAKEDHVGGPTLYNIHFHLVHAYADMKRFEDAYNYAELAAELKDSITNNERRALTSKLDITYQTAEKDKVIMGKQLLLSRRESELSKKNYWIAGISGSSLFVVILLGSLYRNNRLKQKAQIEKMSLLQKEKEISNLKSVISGEERERTRLARDLHDGIMVLFSAVKMNVRTLPQRHPSLLENSDLSEINLQLDHAIKELRRTAHNLMPDMLLEGGLGEAIFYFCKSLKHNNNLDIVFQQYGAMPRLQDEFELSLYRIVQELIQNIIKHAGATKALVQLNYRDDLAYITVEDNGRGFSSGKLTDGAGMGLKSIRTRMRALNGTIDMRSSEQYGTTIYLEFDIRSVIKSKSNEHAY